MNKQEALAYIESGHEAVQARSERYLTTGESVRLIGYGYRTPGRRDHYTKREEYEFLRKDGATGVLVERLNPNLPSWQKRWFVAQLRQLFATTRKQAEADLLERTRLYDEDQRRRHNEREESIAYVKRLIESLGVGTLDAPYTGQAYVRLTTDEARTIADQLVLARIAAEQSDVDIDDLITQQP